VGPRIKTFAQQKRVVSSASSNLSFDDCGDLAVYGVGLRLLGIAVSNPAENTDVRLLCWLFVV
jgi:hypothetical protein